MPASAALTEVKLSIEVNLGQDDKGKDINKKTKFGDVRLDILDDDFYAAGESISGLLKGTLTRIQKEESSLVTNLE
ncbi:DUF1659 domain-containing protein [Clostridium fallax]|uniref:DUF1659 domain-containing protein n=1 Tax=Clostridium fallax TaxID=1533 RepID=A0A1M4Z7U5_9CLOT|nr:DUF1659 domain-containing protein [Clostridium fallax]SHF14143.1 Protein of unknown function [Clostridium fallax]SQB07497.1 Protein of uncharacterised function (DUF1659) [Clostridium fallax]